MKLVLLAETQAVLCCIKMLDIVGASLHFIVVVFFSIDSDYCYYKRCEQTGEGSLSLSCGSKNVDQLVIIINTKLHAIFPL